MKKETEYTVTAEPDVPTDAVPIATSGNLLPPPSVDITFAGKAKELQSLRDAVVDAAGVGAGLWFSYLFLLFYFLIAVGSVTHRDLLLESPVKLPVLSVDLPLYGFFWLGPAIFLVVHAYVLLHLVLLAGKAGDFDEALGKRIADEDAQKVRRQLPSNIFVQFLAGSREVRSGVMGFMLRLIAQISLVIGPIALLIFFQLQFLPYHDKAITWWHRVAVVADIALLWTLWPSIARGERAGLSRRDLRRVKVVALAFASLAPILLVTAIATFPGEWPQDDLPSLKLIPWPGKPWRWASLHELLIAGNVDLGARKQRSLWSNRLVLPGFDAIDHTKFATDPKTEAAPETISLRARHLEGAVLLGAKLRKADFTAANLNDAELGSADLRGTQFQEAQLQGASFASAQLQGASFDSAGLQGAEFWHAQLQGASLKNANLQGAYFYEAQLQGASLDLAEIQGASLAFAGLEGASFSGAQLQGALLDYTKLEGASLTNADLQSASLDHAEIQGASFHGARLQGALLETAFAWRAECSMCGLDGTRVVSLETRPKHMCSKFKLEFRKINRATIEISGGHTICLTRSRKSSFGEYTDPNLSCLVIGEPSTCDWTPEWFNNFRKRIAEHIPEGDERRDALERLDPTKPLEGEDQMTKVWEAQASSSSSAEVFEKGLADIWLHTGCDGAPPYVIRGLLVPLTSQLSPFRSQSPQLPALAAAFLDEEHCPGAHGLHEAENAALKKIRDRSAPPVPGQ